MGGYSGQRHGEYMLIKEKLLAYETNLLNRNEANSIHGSTTEGSACGAGSPRTESAPTVRPELVEGLI
jgi:hypothetical protein